MNQDPAKILDGSLVGIGSCWIVETSGVFLTSAHEKKLWKMDWGKLVSRNTYNSAWKRSISSHHYKITATSRSIQAMWTSYSCNERAADGALCSGEGRRTTKERRSDASETERLLNVKPEVILGSLTAGYVISDDCQTSRLHNAGTTPNLGAPLDTNQHNYETQQLTRRDRPDFVTLPPSRKKGDTSACL